MRNLIIWSFIGAMLLSCENRVPELNIVREEKVEKLPEESVVLTADDKWVKLQNGLYRAQFEVPNYFSVGCITDVFADQIKSSRKRSVESILENYGIVFGKGASAKYDTVKSLLTVEQTEDQMELIEAYIDFGETRYVEKEAHIRVEIYELPSEQVLQLMASAQSEGEHSPERNAALNAVRQGNGKLIASPLVLCRNGLRSKLDSSVQFSSSLKPAVVDDNTDDDVVAGGTTLEVDVVLGPNEYVVDLNMEIIHYTGQANQLSGGNSDDDSRLLLHRKTITTQFTLHDGNYILIGNWKPTGDPRFEKSDLTHVVFVTASIQRRENP